MALFLLPFIGITSISLGFDILIIAHSQNGVNERKKQEKSCLIVFWLLRAPVAVFAERADEHIFIARMLGGKHLNPGYTKAF